MIWTKQNINTFAWNVFNRAYSNCCPPLLYIHYIF